MKCPFCNNDREFSVKSVDRVSDGVRRRRECGLCKERFTTAEIVIDSEFMGKGIAKSLEKQFEEKAQAGLGDKIISLVKKLQAESGNKNQ